LAVFSCTFSRLSLSRMIARYVFEVDGRGGRSDQGAGD
jgi:hypothetical protein